MTYGKLNDGVLVRWQDTSIKTDMGVICNPSEATLNLAGIYRIEDVYEDGEDHLEGNVIKHYVGKPYEPTEEDRQREELIEKLSGTTQLLEAVERMVATNGATEEDRAMAQDRLNARYLLNELDKLVQTESGTGDAFDPIKYWKDGMAVEEGKWYQCYDEHGNIWEAIKSGVPNSEYDSEYFDVVKP